MNNYSKTDNIVQEKSIRFSIRIVNLYKYLTNSKKEMIMSKQLLRSGTSIGVNIHEAIYAQSKKDFISKMYIALKEASETKYWLRILKETKYLTHDEYDNIEKDCVEILKILTSIVKSAKEVI